MIEVDEVWERARVARAAVVDAFADSKAGGVRVTDGGPILNPRLIGGVEARGVAEGVLLWGSVWLAACSM